MADAAREDLHARLAGAWRRYDELLDLRELVDFSRNRAPGNNLFSQVNPPLSVGGDPATVTFSCQPEWYVKGSSLGVGLQATAGAVIPILSFQQSHRSTARDRGSARRRHIVISTLTSSRARGGTSPHGDRMLRSAPLHSSRDGMDPLMPAGPSLCSG